MSNVSYVNLQLGRTQAIITLPPLPLYDPDVFEEITVTVPGRSPPLPILPCPPFSHIHTAVVPMPQLHIWWGVRMRWPGEPPPTTAPTPPAIQLVWKLSRDRTPTPAHPPLTHPFCSPRLSLRAHSPLTPLLYPAPAPPCPPQST
jgi:hypothetical protein